MTKFFYYVILIVGITNCQEKQDPSFALGPSAAELEVFAENIVSTDLYERDIAISPLGDEIIYTLSNHAQSMRCLVSIKKVNGRWGDKQILDFSGRYNDIEPFISPDGLELFFASNRPIDSLSKRKDYNIWVAKKTNDSWGNPTILNDNINTDKDEFYPSVSNNGNLYFTATRENGIGREDIFVSNYSGSEYQAAKALDTMINSRTFEFNAYISPEEDLLVFSSFGRTDGLGGGDLYYSKKDEGGQWSPAKNMGEIVNSTSLDYCPFVDFKHNNLYFTSNRSKGIDKDIRTVEEFIKTSENIENGMGNIYRIGLEKLKLD